jgi:short-subunit dehydrogenase
MRKVVIITGASSGIGFDTAKLLAEKGYIVYGIARSKIESNLFLSMQVDVTNALQINQAYKTIYEKEKQIDIIINNAGMGISGSIEYAVQSDIQDIFNVNFNGLHYSTQAALPYLRASKGKIINVGSVAGPLSIPFQGFYSASKAAVETYTQALAIELKPMRIQVCTVLPGDIKTSFTKNRRKNKNEGLLYNERVEKSIGVMAKDEINGMSSQYAAKVFLKLVKRKKMPLSKTIGFKYKIFIFLNKVLPKRLVVWIIGRLYGFTHMKNKG